VIDGRDRSHRHHADDPLQQLLGDQAAAVQALGRLIEDLAVFLEMAALLAQHRRNLLELARDDLPRALDDARAVAVGEIFAADLVELLLRRPAA
jgi:hypothetical protein